MPHSEPSEFLAEYDNPVCRPLLLFELDVEGGPLRYSSQTVTWNGNSYTRLAVGSTSIVESDEAGKPQEARVMFSNVTGTLRGLIEPVDLLTGRRITIRLIMRDSSFVAITSGGSPLSRVRFIGAMERPTKIDERTFEISAIGLPYLNKTLPPRRFAERCSAMFKNTDGSGDCTYAGVETECDRTHQACVVRENTHQFLGFRSVRPPRATAGTPGRGTGYGGGAGHPGPGSQFEY